MKNQTFLNYVLKWTEIGKCNDVVSRCQYFTTPEELAKEVQSLMFGFSNFNVGEIHVHLCILGKS